MWAQWVLNGCAGLPQMGQCNSKPGGFRAARFTGNLQPFARRHVPVLLSENRRRAKGGRRPLTRSSLTNIPVQA
jgi:hypothetical protein